MEYTMKSGVLLQEPSHTALAGIKSVLTGSVKRIQKCADEWLLEAGIRYLDERNVHSGDVRNKEYVLTDHRGSVVASAFPGYARGEEPDVAGWPIHRMPKVDHAKVTIAGAEYMLTMCSGQKYTVKDAGGAEILRILHKGIAGGWNVEDDHGFAPEILCGIFVFSRYIEHENEFMII